MRTRVKALLGNNIIKNIFWLSFDKIFKLLIALVAGIWVARYLGPVSFGKINYVYAFIGIITASSTLGVDSFLVKEIIERPAEKDKLLGTAFTLRLVAVLLLSALMLGVFYVLGLRQDYFVIYAILFLTVLVTPFDIIDIEYQAQLKSKRTVIAKNIAYALGAAIKVILIVVEAPFLAFVWIISIETLLAFAILVCFYQYSGANILKWTFEKYYVGDLLKKGWPFMCSGLVIILYNRLDQIMLGYMIGEREVGRFSAAIRITELFYFIPIAVSSSLLPGLVKMKNSSGQNEYMRVFQMYFNWVFLISLGITLFVFPFSSLVIKTLFGKGFIDSIEVLRIHIWAIVPIFFGVASSTYLIVEELQAYSFYRAIIGLLINILLNFLLIPAMKGPGAALAAVISQFFAGTFSVLFFRKTRILFYMQLKSFNIFSWLSKSSLKAK